VTGRKGSEQLAGGVAAAIGTVRARIAAACGRSGRDPGDVALIGATKTVPVETIAEAMAADLTVFAENYVRELAAKAAVLPEARWHFVGRLQTGTVARVADLADTVQSAEPGTALSKLSRRAESAGRVVPCLVQVDLTGRRQGVDPEEVTRFMAEASTLTGIRLVGLMTVPPFTPDPEDARAFFARLRELRDRLVPTWPTLRELSMGMSADFEIAVEEGATMVRVGTALFGERPKKAPGGGSQPIRPGLDDR
jgi:pyridoxal phosphate enzyme (YggS family)